jgi:hypothetical protein
MLLAVLHCTDVREFSLAHVCAYTPAWMGHKGKELWASGGLKYVPIDLIVCLLVLTGAGSLRAYSRRPKVLWCLCHR